MVCLFLCWVWLSLEVTNSLTGVERYKSDTVCIELDRSNNEPRGDAVISDNEQLKREFTDNERRRLVDYFSLLIEIDQQEKARYAKLKDSPKGFALLTAKVASVGFASNPYMAISLVGSINGALNALIARMR